MCHASCKLWRKFDTQPTQPLQMLVLQDELAARSSDAAEQPDTAAQPNALQEEAAVAVRPDPEQDAADSEYPVLTVLGFH